MMKKPGRAIVAIVFFTSLAIGCEGTGADQATLERNKEIVRQAELVINAQAFDELDQYYAENYVRYSQATPGFEEADIAGVVMLFEGFFAAFPDGRQTTTTLVAEDDVVAFWGVFEGTQEGPMPPFPATGARMRSDYAGFHRIEDDKIAETWVTWDNMAMLAQLGLLPDSAPSAGELQLAEDIDQHAVKSTDIVWRPCPQNLPAGCEIAVLEGDPQSEGLFTIRFRLPTGFVVPPHTHPAEERVTLLSGQLSVAFGADATHAKAATFGPGDYYVNARNAIHTVWTDEDSELQITGVGPWQANFVE